jgi:hypothetical protein
MFCTPRLIFSGTKGVVSRFYVLRSITCFQRYRRRWVPFSCFWVPNTFLAIPRASASVFIFCASGPIFGGTDGVGSRCHVLRSLTNFRRYRVLRVPFSYFALLDPFSAVPTALGSDFMFCPPEPVFGGTDSVIFHFQFLRSRTRFPRYIHNRVPFSCFALPESFSAVPRASGPVFMFCSLGLIFGGTEGV